MIRKWISPPEFVPSSGAVAYSVVAILPPSLVLNVSSGTGAAALFALLVGAVIWKFGTWYPGMPCSSSHSLIELEDLRANFTGKNSIAQIPLQDRPARRQSAFLAQETLKKLAKEKRIGAKDMGPLQDSLKRR